MSCVLCFQGNRRGNYERKVINSLHVDNRIEIQSPTCLFENGILSIVNILSEQLKTNNTPLYEID
jgi:hypothetical protein